MKPHDDSQPWPSTAQPAPAWTKTVDGKAYTVKRVAEELFGIWRENEDLGTFYLRRHESGTLQPSYRPDLVLEARAVITQFIASYEVPFEGAAKRDEAVG